MEVYEKMGHSAKTGAMTVNLFLMMNAGVFPEQGGSHGMGCRKVEISRCDSGPDNLGKGGFYGYQVLFF